MIKKMTKPGEKYQGQGNLHQLTGIHKINRLDRPFRDKLFDRILDVYEKDKMMDEMREDGFTHMIPPIAKSKFPHLHQF